MTIVPRPEASGVLRRIKSDESGMALVLVVGSMLVLAMLLMTGLAYAVSSTRFSRFDQDYSAAMTAAQSGVEDYISRLNRDDNYGRTPDCGNPAMQNPTDCGGIDYGWLPVEPGVTADRAAHFHYRVDTSRAYTEGTIMVVSTGRVNGVYRTIEVAVGKGGSTDYVYYTDFESADPDNLVAYPSGASSRDCGRDGAALAKYFYQGRSGCQEIQFGSHDELDGRVFSNDAILSVGGRFLQTVESAYPRCRDVVPGSRSTWNQCLRNGSSYTSSGGNATFQEAPKYAPPLFLADNSGAFVDVPGCHYYGATRIVFNANGTMTVWSKNSTFSGAVIAVAPDGGSTPSCGSNSALQSDTGATVPVPSDLAIYVAGAPTTGAGQVIRRQLYAGEIDGKLVSGSYNGKLPLGTYRESHSTGPTGTGQSYTVDANMLDPRKYAGEGNLYVQGTVKGRVTLAAAQSIVVTGDIVLAGGPNGGDIVGLVATNSVEVMHPWMKTVESYRSGSRYYWRNPSGGSEYTSTTWPTRITDPARGGGRYPTSGIQIAASIQTLQHSFTVQFYNEGPSKGDLFVHGSIAQRWRGAVGTSAGNGYDKDYRYDLRLQYTAPPFFPHWINAQWSLRYSGEIATPSALQTP